jgi:hypothetical protein
MNVSVTILVQHASKFPLGLKSPDVVSKFLSIVMFIALNMQNKEVQIQQWRVY